MLVLDRIAPLFTYSKNASTSLKVPCKTKNKKCIFALVTQHVSMNRIIRRLKTYCKRCFIYYNTVYNHSRILMSY